MKLSKEQAAILIKNVKTIGDCFEELKQLIPALKQLPYPDEMTTENFEDPNDLEVFQKEAERVTSIMELMS